MSTSVIYIPESTGGGTTTVGGNVMEFRLTLASATPVMTSQVLAATTLYMTPYIGNKISLYVDGVLEVVTTNEVALSLSGTAINTNYDIFAYSNAGNVALEYVAWSNNGLGTSTRATSLAYQSGMLVKSGDISKRYIGTIRTTDIAGQCQFSFGGTALTGTEAKLFVWNYYNSLEVACFVAASTTSWTYNNATSANYVYRAALNSNNFRVSFIVGLAERAISASYTALIQLSSGSGTPLIGVGLNSTSSAIGTGFIDPTGGAYHTTTASATAMPVIGFNCVTALEAASGGVTGLYYGSGYTASGGQPRVYGLVFMGRF